MSALTIFRVFVAPAIRRAAGLPDPPTATVSARMARAETYEPGRRRLLPVGLVTDGDGDLLAYPVDKGSGATTSLAVADGIVPFPADTTRLAENASVEVELFTPGEREPSVLVVGEDDPAFSRALDALDRPRYLTRGSRGGMRWLRDGITDCAVVAGPNAGREDGSDAAREIASWTREWGMIVPAGNPADVTGLGDLVDRDLRFVNRTTASGLRTSLGNSIAALAEKRGVDRHEIVDSVVGFDTGVRAHESPARRVRRGDADVGLGVRETAERLEMGFVQLGVQSVRVLAAPDRIEKQGVAALRDVVANGTEVIEGLAGYDVA